MRSIFGALQTGKNSDEGSTRSRPEPRSIITSPRAKSSDLIALIQGRLRAKEIASLTWSMVTNAEGEIAQSIHLTDEASKGRSGRIVPMSKDLRQALTDLLQGERDFKRSPYVVTTERTPNTTPAVLVNLFAGWYKSLGFNGASSHSGRRTAITNWARKISTVGGSLRDVQTLAGHGALTTTQRYIEAHADAQRRVVDF